MQTGVPATHLFGIEKTRKGAIGANTATSSLKICAHGVCNLLSLLRSVLGEGPVDLEGDGEVIVSSSKSLELVVLQVIGIGAGSDLGGELVELRPNLFNTLASLK